MYINRQVQPFAKAEIYPFVDDPADAATSDSITVSLNNVLLWRGRQWSVEDPREYIVSMSAAVDAAKQIIGEHTPGK